MITDAKIPIKYLGRYIRELGPRGIAAINRGMKSGAMRAITVLQKEQDEKDASNTGLMRRSWKVQPGNNFVRVFNAQAYASVVDEGRRPGRFPPTAMIARWAQRRLGLSADEAAHAAFPIARAIARRGIVGRHIIQDSLDKVIEVAQTEVERELLVEMMR